VSDSGLRARRLLARLRRPAWLGTARRTSPLSEHWGRERGTPVDRYYIERFLEQNRHSITGSVIEVMNAEYTERFGTAVNHSSVLDIDPANPAATIVTDIASANDIPTASFDCFILTQTLQYVFNVESALRHVCRMLRPGGVLLCTVPAVSRIGGQQLESEYWRFTPAVCARLFGDVFGTSGVETLGRGNVLTCIAFLLGMAAEELKSSELALDDPFFPLVVTVRATKST